MIVAGAESGWRARSRADAYQTPLDAIFISEMLFITFEGALAEYSKIVGNWSDGLQYARTLF